MFLLRLLSRWAALTTLIGASVACDSNQKPPPDTGLVDARADRIEDAQVTPLDGAVETGESVPSVTTTDGNEGGLLDASIATDGSLVVVDAAVDMTSSLEASVFDAETTSSDVPAPPEPCEVVAPTTCPEPAPGWSEIEPIIEQRCVVCHYGAVAGPWPLTNYEHVADWQSEIRGAMLDCSMPPLDDDVRITADERSQILDWIRCGLPR